MPAKMERVTVMVAEEEKLVGIEEYLTDTDGIGGKLRKTPEDFIVKETSITPPEAPNGTWTIATVTSRNWETNRLIRILSKDLRVSRDRIRFAGTKDKRAVTTQLMAFKVQPDRVKAIQLKDVTIENVYLSNKGIDIGDLIGNQFEIKVSDLKFGAAGIVEDTACQVKDLEGFPNYFGIQRFGAIRPVTHLVGKAIVRGEFDKAVMQYLGNPTENEDPEIQQIRRSITETGDLKEALKRLPPQLSFERTMLQHLVRREKDYIGALRQLPKNLLMMFIHAYQSYLFNLMLSERMRRGLPLNTPIAGDMVIPTDKNGLPNHEEWIKVDKDNLTKVIRQCGNGNAFVSGLVMGAGTEFADGSQGEIEHKVIEAEGLVNKDFIIPDMPEMSSKGIRREVVSPVFNLKYHEVEDGIVFTFKLNRGCYATCLMREFMKSDDIRSY